MIWRRLPHGARSNAPTGIVVHAMGHVVLVDGEPLYAATALDRLGLSAHALIAPDGTVIRCRTDDEGAFHAKGHNKNSLGVEFLVPGQHDYASFCRAIAEPGWVSDAQFAAGVALLRQWCARHPIEWIKRHLDIDAPRKPDPGAGFPWTRFLAEVQHG